MNPEDTVVMSRREFTQLWSLLIGLFSIGAAKAVPTDNTGFWEHRISDKIPEHWRFIEKALADQWEYENRPYSHNHENGLLSSLLEGTRRMENPPELADDYEPTARERKIVATVIQWLGTNCGRSFLNEASCRMGARCYPFQKAIDAFYASDRNDRDRHWKELLAKTGKHGWLPILPIQ